MSTSRSALELLREEPTLVGAVLHLVSSGLLRSASTRAAIPLEAFVAFAGAPGPTAVWMDEQRRWPRVTAIDGAAYVRQADLIEWLDRLASDRSDFAPAIPRALPGGRVA